jgi:DNA gyrase inhibitor GyrI
MKELEVQIVKLEPLRVVKTLGFGPNPEELAWKKLEGWFRQNNIVENLKAHRFFGFNNPGPTPGSPNYGYEQWATTEEKPAGELEIMDFPGGLYAVTHCKLANITETWRQLVLWRENSPYQTGYHQWLEECLTPEIFLTDTGIAPEEAEFKLYLPVKQD